MVTVDALGTPALGNALVGAIRAVTSQPIRRVILTHYHADHFYGVIALKDAGADIWAQKAALEYLNDGEAERRREQRAKDLFPWVDDSMPIVRADHWIDESESFTMGRVAFDIQHMGPAHSPEDVIVVVPSEGVIFSGDILFAGRIPFVGEADSKRWLQRIDKLLALHPKIMITGHGEMSRDPAKDLALTRDYLLYLRASMGKAVEDFVPFEEAYAKTDWSRFSKVPAFDAANRINAYGTYLLMEKGIPGALRLFGREVVVLRVEECGDVLFLIRKHLEVELAVAKRDLRLQLLEARHLAVLARIDGLGVAGRLARVAGLALLLGHELASFGHVARRVGETKHQN